MARFVYLGPIGEQVASNWHAITGEWVTGVAREIEDAAAVEWLRRHPHWAEISDEGIPVPRVTRRPGRPRKVPHAGA